MEQEFFDNPLLAAYHFVGFCFFLFFVSQWLQDLKSRILKALEVGLAGVHQEQVPISAEREFNRVRFEVAQELRFSSADVVLLFAVWLAISLLFWPLLAIWHLKDKLAARWRKKVNG